MKKKLQTLLIISTTLLLGACATDLPTNGPDPAVNQKNAVKNAHNAAARQVFTDAGKILGPIAVKLIVNSVEASVEHGRVDYVHSLANSLQQQVDVGATIAEFKSIAHTYSAGKVSPVVSSTTQAFADVVNANPDLSKKVIAQAIANVTFAAAGTPPAK